MAKDNKNNQTKKVNPIVATFGELKQVSWPTFGQTMKRLGTVLVVTLAFLVVLIGVDSLLGFIYRELFSLTTNDDIYLQVTQMVALIVGIVLVVAAIAGVIAYKVVKASNSKKD